MEHLDNSGTPHASLRLLLCHCAVAAAAYAAALLSPYLSGLPWGRCIFRELTGLCCITCGATRAAHSLALGHLRASLLLNPVSPLLAAWLCGEILRDIIALCRKRARKFSAADFIAPAAILVVSVIYCVLRNIGIAPLPESVII